MGQPCGGKRSGKGSDSRVRCSFHDLPWPPVAIGKVTVRLVFWQLSLSQCMRGWVLGLDAH